MARFRTHKFTPAESHMDFGGEPSVYTRLTTKNAARKSA
jgi:hypothetical protein